MGAPKTLPADFFEKQAANTPPKTLPGDFDFSKAETPESQRPDAIAQAQAAVKATPMKPSYSAMAVGHMPTGADPHNPGNPNLKAIPESERQSVNNRALATQASILAGQGAGAGISKALAPSVASEVVGTGILGPSGEEIMREGLKYGPSAAARAISNPMAQQILKWVGKGVALGAAWKAIEALGILKKPRGPAVP